MTNTRIPEPGQLENAATVLKSMAHPVRIAILNLLGEENQMTVTDIHTCLGIEQPAASHHLGILKDKGVLCSRREGKNTVYFLKNKILSRVIDCVNQCTCDQAG